MIIYLHGSADKLPVADHTLICAPAGHLPREFVGDDWWDNSGERPRPRQFEVRFIFGEAEVADPLGRYLVETGQAQRSRLIVPNSWSR